MEEEIFPVCSPEYADTYQLWNNPQQLTRCLFLYDAMASPSGQYHSEWKSWLDAEGIIDLNLKNSYTFDCSNLAVLSAIEGLGVARDWFNDYQLYKQLLDLMIRHQLLNKNDYPTIFFVIEETLSIVDKRFSKGSKLSVSTYLIWDR